MILVVTWPSSFFDLLEPRIRDGSSGKTSLESSQAEEAGTLVPSSGKWRNSGMAAPGECWTLRFSESPSVVVESSLSRILETGDLPSRYYLGPRTCAGIARRIETRGKKIPKRFSDALEKTMGRSE